MKNKTNIIIAAVAAAAMAIPPASQAQHPDGDSSLLGDLKSAKRLMEGIPSMEGKSEEEVKAILAAHPEYGRKIDQAEKIVQEALAKTGVGIDVAALEALLRELESMQELKDKSEDEVAQVMATNLEVRRRMSSVGRRVAKASAGGAPDADVENPAPAETALVPDDVGEVVTLPDGTTTNVIDDVFFGELNWDYGGFNGSKAEMGDVLISSLKMKRDGLSFKYIQDLSSWGMAHTDYSGALACLFVQDNDGKWVGGKFDWISSSRNKRDFANVYSGYHGWNLSNVPNPTTAAFVIVSKNGKRRSNVISALWER